MKKEIKKPEVNKPAPTDAEQAAELVAKLAALAPKKDASEEYKQLAKQTEDLVVKLMTRQQDCEAKMEATARELERLRGLRQALTDATNAVRDILRSQPETKGEAV